MELLFFILVCFGLTKILVRSSIIKPIREFLGWKMLNCCLCTGFHTGYIIYFLMFPQFSIIQAFFYACISSGCSYLIDAIIDDKGIRIERL
ncbi:MAG: hypothetical protein H8D97_00620 [Proteobacteria bacterium]|nr:hypothetical protein [Pseudomonadota bacterium]